MHGLSVLKLVGLKGSAFGREYVKDLKLEGKHVIWIREVQSKLGNVAPAQTFCVLKVCQFSAKVRLF